MINVSEPRPERYSKIVVQVFSPVHGAWCDYRDLTEQDAEEGLLDQLSMLHRGFRFRLVTRYINDIVIAH